MTRNVHQSVLLDRFAAYLLFIFLFTVGSLYAQELELTREEKIWIAKNPVITVGGEKDWPPFDYVDTAGNYTGMVTDYLGIISETTGLKVEMDIDDWSALMDKIKDGRIDLLPAIYYSDERTQFLNFTDAYSRHAEFIFVKEGNPHYHSLEELHGKKITVIEGYTIEEYLRSEHPEIELVTGKNLLEALDLLLSGQADAFINDIASTSHMARQYNIVGFEPTALLEERIQHLHMATRKENPFLHSIIEKALKQIDADTHRSIREKWIIMTPQKEKSPRLVLTPDEEAWLEQHPILHTTSDPSWMPYEGTDKSGNFVGMFSDMTALIAKRLGITVDYIAAKDWDDVIHMAQHKKVDFLTAIPTDARKDYLTFTSPVIVKELALLTRKEHPIIASFSTLEKKKVALITGYGYNEEVLRKYPDHDYFYVHSLQEGLHGLSSNQYDIFIANITSSLYYISKEMLTDLQVAGTLDISFEIAYGVRDDWKIFHDILEKALLSITDEERQEILNRWVKVDVVQKMDYTLLYQFGGIFLLIVLIILYWNRRLHREIERRHAAEIQLQKSHDEIQTLLDTAQNIIIVSDGKTLLNANRAFLDFFGYEELDDFFAEHQCICDFFIEHDDYFHLGKIEEPSLWIMGIKKLPETEQIVTMQGEHTMFPSAFSVRVSELNDSGEFVVSFTDITGIKMESKRHEYQATHDPLTGLYNRLYIDRYLTHELQKCRELTISVSIIMLDIDYFKQVNDTYGHAAGDEVLKDLSNLLNVNLRTSDKASRWGGEEFLIVLSSTNLEQAEVLAEKLRKKVVTHDFKEPQKISCSFGVASAKENDTIESLVNRADDALYRAKETGRNRVVVNG